jgi:IclR family transcriptional regulator, acetate operon repressor
VYLDRVEAAWPLRMDFKPGSHVPVHCTANGKLLLAHASPAVRDRLLPSLRLIAHTPRTIVNRRELARQLATGFAEDNEEFLVGVNCLDVPVRDRGRRVVAGLAVSARSLRFDLERARTHLPDLIAAAEEIGEQFHE